MQICAICFILLVQVVNYAASNLDGDYGDEICPCGKRCFVQSPAGLRGLRTSCISRDRSGICPRGSLSCGAAESEVSEIKTKHLTKQEEIERTIFVLGMNLEVGHVCACMVMVILLTFALGKLGDFFKEKSERQWHHQKIYNGILMEFAMLGLLSFCVVMVMSIYGKLRCCCVVVVMSI